VGQDPRHQARPGYDDQTQLLKEREGIQLEPVLHDSAVVAVTVELEALERHLLARRREPLEDAGVRAFEVDPLRYEITFAHGILHREAKVGKTLDEAGKELGPRLRPQRVRLQTRGREGDELGRTHVRLRRVVAQVEHLDPPP
jgi:hypothetical protein